MVRGVGGETLGNIVSIISEVAVTTSLIDFIYGLLDKFTNDTNLPTTGSEVENTASNLSAENVTSDLSTENVTSNLSTIQRKPWYFL